MLQKQPLRSRQQRLPGSGKMISFWLGGLGCLAPCAIIHVSVGRKNGWLVLDEKEEKKEIEDKGKSHCTCDLDLRAFFTIRWRSGLERMPKNPDAGVKSETEGGEESTRLWPPVCVVRCRFFTNGASVVTVHDAAFGIFSNGGVSWNDPR